MEVIHDEANQEFKIELDKSTSDKAHLTYELHGDTIDFQHTFVPTKYRGQGIAEKLVQNALNFVDNENSIKKIIPSCSYMTTIRLKLPSNLYRPWKPLYRQRSKKQQDPPAPYTPLEQQIYDHAKIKFDQRINILRSIFAKEGQSLSTKSRFAQLQLKAEEQEFKQLINMVKEENERLLTMRRNDERLLLEEEERIRSQVINILSEKQFNEHLNIEEEVKQIKNESRSWVNKNDLLREIERMLNEKHDYNFSIDLAGIKRTQLGKDIIDQHKPNLVSITSFELEPKNVARKPPGASKYEE
ncbi:unnamed protein product [Rotaria sp. Silwood1]|nr:unnamed protein product [Rotaria sp. Silwood1]CAF1596439.1 unnamed protein product [Rotaria sp. Silwood1]CAF3719045.1 unnamed protein product [Rotaria sp. Silwood1]CAF3752059.1 unnamed protein product [Rotaria sp. Silwood1]CAF3792324.1 unnamed protein product [Rotaria sp. Silwood1]